ncbi:Acylphosphatase [Labeo rohita]|uniref:Acylphosphatase n=1 Tax=Labeo rohita TaxID=84645 RepID=A0ABQ8L8L7_LABRO|nr:Acylphosphatase [Labeo rohita]
MPMSTELPCGVKGRPATKQTISRWIVDAISTSYESSDRPSPMGLRAHSTRATAASKALMLGVPIQDICNAAGWSTPLTFQFTRQGLRSLVAWASRSQSVSGRSSSSRRGLSQVTYVTMVPEERDAASRFHPSGIPAERSLHSPKLTPAGFAQRGSAKGVPKAFPDAASRSLGEPWLHT